MPCVRKERQMQAIKSGSVLVSECQMGRKKPRNLCFRCRGGFLISRRISVKECGDHDPGDDDRGYEPQNEYQRLVEPRGIAAAAAARELHHQLIPVHLPADENRNEDACYREHELGSYKVKQIKDVHGFLG